MVDDARHCSAQRKDGRPCQAPALPGKPFCFAHDPALQQVRLEGCKRGGRHKAKTERLRKLMPQDLRHIFDLLKMALEEVHAGIIAPNRAAGMASLASAMVKVLEAGELTERVAKLESVVEEMEERRCEKYSGGLSI